MMGKKWQLSQPPGDVNMSSIAIEDPNTTSSLEFIQLSSNMEFLCDRNITIYLMLDNTLVLSEISSHGNTNNREIWKENCKFS